MAHIASINTTQESWNEIDADLIAVGIFEDKSLKKLLH